MLQFLDWKCVYGVDSNDPINYIELQNSGNYLELSINRIYNQQNSDYEYYIYVTYNSPIFYEMYTKFSELKFGKKEPHCFADIESAKLYVQDFIIYLNRCMKLPSFL